MSWPEIEPTAVLFHNAGIPAGLTAQIATVVHTAGLAAVVRLGAGAISRPEPGKVFASFLGDATARGLDDRAVIIALGEIARAQTALHDGVEAAR